MIRKGTATATLSGEGAVAPSGTKVPADASFTYTATSTTGKAGKVALEARSRRGVAEADLNFDTAEDSWIGTASYSAADMSTTGQITWVFVGSDKNVSMYKSTGPGTAAYDDGTCRYPAASTSTDSAGVLFVDFNTTPPTGRAYPESSPSRSPASRRGVRDACPTGRAAAFGGTKGPEGVEAAGVVMTQDAPMTIEESDTDGSGGTFRWSFRRGR